MIQANFRFKTVLHSLEPDCENNQKKKGKKEIISTFIKILMLCFQSGLNR